MDRHRDPRRPPLLGGLLQDHGGFPCPPILPTCRRAICARPRPPALSGFPFEHWRNTASTARALAIPSSAGVLSIESKISRRGSSRAPRRLLPTLARRRCCRPRVTQQVFRRPPTGRAADPCRRDAVLGPNGSSSNSFGLCPGILRRGMRRTSWPTPSSASPRPTAPRRSTSG